MMTRSFLPVGQGAFYIEKFALDSGSASIIYDCGSSTSVSLVERMIQGLFCPGEEIAGVFISHFDSDHTNGLPFLLKHCRVKNLFFPLLAKESAKFISLSGLLNPLSRRPFFASFVEDPHAALDTLMLDYRPHLYQIQEEDSGERFQDDRIASIPSGRDVSSILFDSGQRVGADWRYIPFNFRETARTAEFKAAMLDRLGRVCTCAQLRDLLVKGDITLHDVRQIYRAVPGSFNTNSMTVLSVSVDDKIVQAPSRDLIDCPHYSVYSRMCRCEETCGRRFANGCLYTGDYDARGPQKWRELRRAYDEYESCIGCLQIPHHGSVHNYNEGLLEIGGCGFYVISAGSRNRYQHPHAAVIKSIIMNGKFPIVVTEGGLGASFDIFSN